MQNPNQNSPLTQAAPNVEVFSIEPCFIVIDRIKVDRAVSYEREELGTVHNPDGSEDSEWKTTRHFISRDEAEQANQAYHRARYRLAMICTKTDLGFVCPVSKEDELKEAIEEANQIVEEANSEFKHCQLTFRVVCTRLEPENESGAAALRDSILSQTKAIQEALQEFDTRKARTLLRASKGYTDMLSDPKAKARLQGVQQEAADLAKEMSKAVRECGNAAEAALSPDGKKALGRVNAQWNIF